VADFIADFTSPDNQEDRPVNSLSKICVDGSATKRRSGAVISLEWYAFKPLYSHLLTLSLCCNIIFCRVFVFVSVFRSYGEYALYIMDFFKIYADGLKWLERLHHLARAR
jgi:hypothetical protein